MRLIKIISFYWPFHFLTGKKRKGKKKKKKSAYLFCGENIYSCLFAGFLIGLKWAFIKEIYRYHILWRRGSLTVRSVYLDLWLQKVWKPSYTSPHFPRIFILPLLLIWLLVDTNSYGLPLKSASVSLNKYLVYGPRDTSVYVQYTS